MSDPLCKFCRGSGKIELPITYVDCECVPEKFNYDVAIFNVYINDSIDFDNGKSNYYDNDLVFVSILRTRIINNVCQIYLFLELGYNCIRKFENSDTRLIYSLGEGNLDDFNKQCDKFRANYYELTFEKLKEVYQKILGHELKEAIQNYKCKWCKDTKILSMLTSNDRCSECAVEYP